MALFEKKYCDFCGNKIGLLSEKKLKNGSMCKTCSLKLSPLYKYGITTTTEEIQEHLIYREKNRTALNDFNPTLELGIHRFFYLDFKKGVFAGGVGEWYGGHSANKNPDLVSFSQIQGCHYYTTEVKTEIYTKDTEGNRVSFSPPQYEYSYNYFVTLKVNHPYFKEYEKQINDSPVKANNPLDMEKHKHCCEKIVKTFRDIIAPKTAIPSSNNTSAEHNTDSPRPHLFCMECGEKLPKIGKFCPFCGTKI